MKELTRATHALSDETRVRIINLIIGRECCVCEVMQALGISQTRASRNLKILYDAGFLNMRNDGLFKLYSINPENDVNFRTHLLQAVRRDLRKNTIARKDLQQLEKARRIGPGCASGPVK
ncbi:MAG: metalloregulator ArsR/SmtB family transcription factor [Dehalococcoidales bacterium]|nr:metalloregulator ArsR/SmtB family transcription factor [Dehalococcoidales bacterium]